MHDSTADADAWMTAYISGVSHSILCSFFFFK